MNQTQKISWYLRNNHVGYHNNWFTKVGDLKSILWIKNVVARMYDVEKDLLNRWYILERHKFKHFPFNRTYRARKMYVTEKILFRLKKLLCKIRNQK